MFNDTTDFEDIQKNTAEGVEVLKSTSTMNEDPTDRQFCVHLETIDFQLRNNRYYCHIFTQETQA